MVEQLTLNQWAQGSSPWRCTNKNREQVLTVFSFSDICFSVLEIPCHIDRTEVFRKRKSYLTVFFGGFVDTHHGIH